MWVAGAIVGGVLALTGYAVYKVLTTKRRQIGIDLLGPTS
jgi:hypothetical protein